MQSDIELADDEELLDPLHIQALDILRADAKEKLNPENKDTYGWMYSTLTHEILRLRNRKLQICCGIYRKEFPGIANTDYTIYDVIAIILCWIVMLGCWFIMAVLSLKLGANSTQACIDATLTFIEDFFTRMVFIIIIQAIYFLPQLACLSACCALYCLKNDVQRRNEQNEKRKQVDDLPGVDITFTTGPIGFKFKNRRVYRVDPCLQAHDLGVRPMWTIVAVDKFVVENDEDIIEALERCHMTLNHFEIRFCTGGKLETLDYLDDQKGKNGVQNPLTPIGEERAMLGKERKYQSGRSGEQSTIGLLGKNAAGGGAQTPQGSVYTDVEVVGMSPLQPNSKRSDKMDSKWGSHHVKRGSTSSAMSPVVSPVAVMQSARAQGNAGAQGQSTANLMSPASAQTRQV